jgi:hypothetical protein
MSQEILSQITKSITDHSEETNTFKQAALDNNNASMQSINGLGDLLNNQNSNIAKSTSAVGQYNTLAQQDIELQQQTNSLLSQILAASRQLMFSGDPRGARLSGSGIGALALGGAAAFLGDGNDSGYSAPGSSRYDPPTVDDPPASFTPGVTSSTGGGDSGMARELAAQRANRGANKLSLEQKRHLYALAIAEMGGPEYMKTKGDSTVIQGYAAFMETAYNRGMTEGRSNENVSVNLQANYYQPLRAGERKHYDRAFKKLGDTNSDLYKLMDSAHDLVAKGSNYSKLATQNSSAHVAASAKRTQTITSTDFGETLSRKDLVEHSNIHGAGTVKKTIEWVSGTREQAKKFDEQNRSNTKTIQKNAPPKPRNSSSFKLQPLSRNELRAKGGSWGTKPGDRTIFMDFNAFSDASAKGFEIIIPNDATHAEIAAAVKFRDNWVALASKYGMTTTVRSGGAGMPAGIKKTKQNYKGRGRAGAFHTESWFGSHKESARIMANPDFQKDYAVILSEFSKDMPGSTLQTPHDINSQGAEMRWGNERISEYGFSKKILVPLLKQIQEEDARARGLPTHTTKPSSSIIPSSPLSEYGVGATGDNKKLMDTLPESVLKLRVKLTGGRTTTLQDLGVTTYSELNEKGGQAFAGGKFGKFNDPNVTFMAGEIQDILGGAFNRTTAQNDSYHHGPYSKIYMSEHLQGIKLDFTINGNYNSEVKKLVSEMKSRYGLNEPSDFKIVRNFKHGTGKHVDIKFTKSGREKVLRIREERKKAGSTPEDTTTSPKSINSGFVTGGAIENITPGEQILLDIDKELPDETPGNGAVLGLHETVNLATNNIKNAGQILASATAPNIVLPGKTSTKPAFSPEEPATMVG